MAALQPIPGLEWYDVNDPASPALDELARRYQLHQLQVEDCRHRPQRAKYEEFSRYLFCVLKQCSEDDNLVFEDFDVFLGTDFIVTVHHGECKALDRIRKRAGEERVQRVDRLFYMIVDELVDDYLLILDDLSEESSSIESEVLINPTPAMLQRIFVLKRKLIEFRRISAAMREVVNNIARREHGIVGDDLDPYFRDIYDHLIRTVDLIESYRDLLTGSLDIYLSAVANRTNEVMKILTIYGTVALPLVIITGFFGMNLPLPWTQSAHGLGYAVGLMGISTIIVLAFFKRKGWF